MIFILFAAFSFTKNFCRISDYHLLYNNSSIAVLYAQSTLKIILTTLFLKIICYNKYTAAHSIIALKLLQFYFWFHFSIPI